MVKPAVKVPLKHGKKLKKGVFTFRREWMGFSK